MTILHDEPATRNSASAKNARTSTSSDDRPRPSIPKGIGHKRTEMGFISLPLDFLALVKPKAKGGRYQPSDRTLLEFFERYRLNWGGFPGVWPSLKTIRAETGLEIRTIQDSLTRLAGDGWVLIDEQLVGKQMLRVYWLRWLLVDDGAGQVFTMPGGYKTDVATGKPVRAPKHNPGPTGPQLFFGEGGAEIPARDSAQEGKRNFLDPNVDVREDANDNANAASPPIPGNAAPVVPASDDGGAPEPSPVAVAGPAPAPIPVAQCLAELRKPRLPAILAGPFLWALEDQGHPIPEGWTVPPRPEPAKPKPARPAAGPPALSVVVPEAEAPGQGRDDAIVRAVKKLRPDSPAADVNELAYLCMEKWRDARSLAWYRSKARQLRDGTLSRRAWLRAYDAAEASMKAPRDRARLFNWLLQGN